MPKHKDSPHLYGGESVEEGVIIAMFHNGETYPVLQLNGVGEAYYKYLNQ